MPNACPKKHKACCKKYKPYILKYKALISKYMPCIFRLFGSPEKQQVTKPQKFRFFALFSVLPDNAFTMCGDECL